MPLQVGQAGLAAARQRHRDCSELVSEMEVQSRAIDSARKSVEVHYTYIHSQLSSFIQQCAPPPILPVDTCALLISSGRH